MSKARKTTKQRAKPKTTIDCQLKHMDEFIPGLAGLLLSLVDEDLRNERRAATMISPDATISSFPEFQFSTIL